MTVRQFFRQIFRLPRTLAKAARRRRGRFIRNELELERLDRIRNPDKYLGK